MTDLTPAAPIEGDTETETTSVEGINIQAAPWPWKNGLSSTQVGRLMTGIHRSRIATRSQGGKSLSYVEAYDIKATLIRLFGFGGFDAEVIDSKIVSVREYAAGTLGHVNTGGQSKGEPKTPQVIAQSTVRLTIHGIGPGGRDAVYTETAIGANSGWDIGETADNAIKTASSDALKRCAIYLGDQFGLSLYRDGSTDPLVQVIFEPEQMALLTQYNEEIAAQAGQQQPDANTQQALHRATGNG